VDQSDPQLEEITLLYFIAPLRVFTLTLLLIATTLNSAYATTVKVSWYGPGFHGKKTANCEVFNQNALTVAIPPSRKKKYPFGTKFTLTNTKNGRSVRVRVTDTGSFAKYGRDLDVAKAVAKKLDFVKAGVVTLKISDVKKPKKPQYGECT
jgi:rare lipoprotein A